MTDPFRALWDVFESHPDGRAPCLEIQRVDSPDETVPPYSAGTRFPNDDVAVAHVMNRACRERCPEARAAVLQIVESWTEKEFLLDVGVHDRHGECLNIVYGVAPYLVPGIKHLLRTHYDADAEITTRPHEPYESWTGNGPSGRDVPADDPYRKAAESAGWRWVEDCMPWAEGPGIVHGPTWDGKQHENDSAYDTWLECCLENVLI